jgi:hypothetical protein
MKEWRRTWRYGYFKLRGDYGGADETRTRDLLRDRQAF